MTCMHICTATADEQYYGTVRYKLTGKPIYMFRCPNDGFWSVRVCILIEFDIESISAREVAWLVKTVPTCIDQVSFSTRTVFVGMAKRLQ